MLKLSNENVRVTSVPKLLNRLSIVHSDINVRSRLVRPQLDRAGCIAFVLSLYNRRSDG